MFERTGSKLEGNLEFKNFQKALDFVNIIGKLAEKYDHHPDIFLHSYRKVKIMLFTHSENKITKKDYELADEIETLI